MPRTPQPRRAEPDAGMLADAADARSVDTAGRLITVDTDLVRAEISTVGGTIQSMWLKHYAQEAQNPDDKFRLLKPQPPNMFIVQSGLLGGADIELPNHKALFSADRSSFQLTPDADSLSVQLRWSNAAGIEVIKRYRFERGSYLILAEQEIINNSAAPLAVRDYDQLQRTELYDPNKSSFIHTYTGAVYYGPETKYKKESFDDIEKRPSTSLSSMDGSR
jgi:YidC/Oxa1 family membrane protein insertase